MKRSNPIKINYERLHRQEPSKKIAMHEAGHAAAIHLGNQQKQLPPVFFQIVLQEPNHGLSAKPCQGAAAHHAARIEGGRLIQPLPTSLQDAIRSFSAAEIQAYLCAFEADIINFLVGPLAEAKYVAISDDEPISPRLVNLDSLHYYGGSSDLEVVHRYLDCWLPGPEQKTKKLIELFLAAYRFIDDPSNWRAIVALADYLGHSDKKIIACEEAIAVLDARVRPPEQRKIR